MRIWEQRQQLLDTVKKNQVTVLEGSTGSGKTTQVAQFLLLGDGGRSLVPAGMCLSCTQPRRMAATSVASRVADEMDVTLGEEVGYSVRFENLCTPRTRIKFMTDGMLL